MKKFMSFILVGLLWLVMGPLAASSGEYQMGAVNHSKDFEKMKESAGSS